ncbi:MAG: sulfite exporter TauE/SafE family protein [Planctomycetaceae bacterium]
MQPNAGASELAALCATAVAIGAGHTILGPDHYVPFAAMARAGRWSAAHTVAVTTACGLGHVAGSVVIGLVGIAAGTALTRIEGLEGLRGDVAAWLLVGTGLAYAAWGFVQAVRRRLDGHSHLHAHVQQAAAGTATASVWAPWAMFLVFLFGPCEPLVPLLMYPAATVSPLAVVAVAAAFAAATVATMVAAVLALRAGCHAVRAPRLERYGHALAGLAVAACGLLVVAGL